MLTPEKPETEDAFEGLTRHQKALVLILIRREERRAARTEAWRARYRFIGRCARAVRSIMRAVSRPFFFVGEWISRIVKVILATGTAVVIIDRFGWIDLATWPEIVRRVVDLS